MRKLDAPPKGPQTENRAGNERIFLTGQPECRNWVFTLLRRPQPVVFPVVEDYPRNLLELEARFSSEEACREYLFALRWPEGFRCPRCHGAEFWPLRGSLLECAGCHRQASVTAGTIFQDSRLPLTPWFRAAWWVTSQKNGIG